jgi:endonuclease V-like protein UPF0215 family
LIFKEHVTNFDDQNSADEQFLETFAGLHVTFFSNQTLLTKKFHKLEHCMTKGLLISFFNQTELKKTLQKTLLIPANANT